MSLADTRVSRPSLRALGPQRGAWTAGVAITVAAVLVLPQALDDYWLFLTTSAVIYAVMVYSVGIVTGLAGMMTLCQLSLAAIGAWVFATLNVNGTLPFLLQVLAGGIATIPFGLLIGLPALRLRGINLGVVTLAFAAALDAFLLNNDFPGSTGTGTILVPGFVSTTGSYFTFAVVVAALLFLLGVLARRLPLGSSWLAVRQSERATAALGLSVPRTKLTAFALSAFVAGIGGALLAGQLTVLAASNFSATGSLTLFAVAVMVGAQFPEGAVIGGLLFAFMPEILRRVGIPQDLGNVLFAVGAVQVLMQGAGGMSASLRGAARRLLGRPVGVAGDAGSLEHGVPGTSTAPVPAAPAPGARPILEISCLTVRYGEVHALTDVSLSLPRGTIAGLIGPNGAGKSTLIDAATGFIPGYAGQISLDGRAVDRLSPHQRAQAGLRRSFQQDRTILELSVEAYVCLAAGRRLARSELDDLLQLLAGPAREARLGDVELLARRLVEIAGALAAHPKALLLDEPAAGLLPEESRALGRRLMAIPERFGTSVLLIEHDMELVQQVCSWVTVLDFGRVIASEAPGDALRDPAVAAAYLGEEVAAT